jgi:hypothetical protein
MTYNEKLPRGFRLPPCYPEIRAAKANAAYVRRKNPAHAQPAGVK